MNPLQRHWLEKMLVYATAAVALAAAWFACWHAVMGWDSGILSFLPDGAYARLAAYAGVVWGISLLCAVLTLSAPVEGALLATLIGAAGLSLRSGPARALLWRWPEAKIGQLFSLLALEVLVLGAILGGAMVVILLVRALLRRLLPRRLWARPQGDGGADSADQETKKNPIARMAGAALMEIAVALILLVYTFRSTDRGQIAFALAASFFVAALAAHWTFPVRSTLPFWIGPIFMAAVVFALGSAGAQGGDGPEWYNAIIVARGLPLRAALPVDWLACGCGGAVWGFWASRRIRYARLVRQELAKQPQIA